MNAIIFTEGKQVKTNRTDEHETRDLYMDAVDSEGYVYVQRNAGADVWELTGEVVDDDATYEFSGETFSDIWEYYEKTDITRLND